MLKLNVVKMILIIDLMTIKIIRFMMIREKICIIKYINKTMLMKIMLKLNILIIIMKTDNIDYIRKSL